MNNLHLTEEQLAAQIEPPIGYTIVRGLDGTMTYDWDGIACAAKYDFSVPVNPQDLAVFAWDYVREDMDRRELVAAFEEYRRLR